MEIKRYDNARSGAGPFPWSDFIKKVAVIASSSGGNAEKCIEQLRKAAKADQLAARLSLVDPKSRPSEDNERKISELVAKLKG